MADTKHHHSPPVEGDGISYSGIIWFLVVLTVVTVVCQALMWVLLRTFQYQQATSGVAAAPLSATVTERQAQSGRVYMDMTSIGMPNGPQPRLLVNEPKNLQEFTKQEHEILHTYGWVDRAAGTVRIPIDKAKDLLMERGLPIRGKQ